jgi:MYXO-CTERM domain-containing protein
VTPTPTPQCRQNSDCPSDQVCIDGTCVTVTPTTTPTPTPTFKRGGGGGCNCEIDPGAPASPTAHVLAVLLPALLLALRWRSRRATR